MRTGLPENNELASTKASCFIMHEDRSKGLVNNELAVGETRGKQAFAFFQSRNDKSMT